MTWITRSLPPEPDLEDPPPSTDLATLAGERARLIGQVRRGIRSRRQERILRRIAEITRQLLTRGASR